MGGGGGGWGEARATGAPTRPPDPPPDVTKAQQGVAKIRLIGLFGTLFLEERSGNSVEYGLKISWNQVCLKHYPSFFLICKNTDIGTGGWRTLLN